MQQKVFIPVSDELLFDHPERIIAPLRPYKPGMVCYEWLDVCLNPEAGEAGVDDETAKSTKSLKAITADFSRVVA